MGFRYTAQHVAAQYAIAGFVRNLADGRVELVMEGDESEMERVVTEIEQKLDGFIRQRTDEVTQATGEFGDFSIRH